MNQLLIILLLLVCATSSYPQSTTSSTVTDDRANLRQFQRLADSLRAEIAIMKEYKLIVDEKLANKTAELDNRQQSFENRHYLLTWLLAILGIGTLIGVGTGYMQAKRIVQDRLIKLFDENNDEVIRLFSERNEERALRQSSRIAVLSPAGRDEGIAFRLKNWKYERITPVEIPDAGPLPDFQPVPDCLFFNNKTGGFDPRIVDLIPHYRSNYPQAVIFYFGAKHLPPELTNYVSTANLTTQIPGNLLNALKFRDNN